jgi:hypothetical protein
VVKVTIQGQNVIDMFGLQFTLHYDPSILEMQGEDITFEGGYTVFGGKTVDKSKGILKYPVINKDATPEKKDTETIGYVTFKTLKSGPVIMKMDEIKAVNSNSAEINYNTQTQAVYNIIQPAPAPSNTETNSPGDSQGNTNGSENTNKGENNSTGQSQEGSGKASNEEGQNLEGEAGNSEPNSPASGSKATEGSSIIDGKEVQSNKNPTSTQITVISIMALLIIASGIYGIKNKETLNKAVKDTVSKIKKRKESV